jgi:hypothetical protein
MKSKAIANLGIELSITYSMYKLYYDLTNLTLHFGSDGQIHISHFYTSSCKVPLQIEIMKCYEKLPSCFKHRHCHFFELLDFLHFSIRFHTVRV